MVSASSSKSTEIVPPITKNKDREMTASQMLKSQKETMQGSSSRSKEKEPHKVVRKSSTTGKKIDTYNLLL